MTSTQCSRLQPQSPPRYGSGTGSMPFLQAPAGTRRIIGGWRRSGWLWCCGRSCWWCSRRMNKRSSPVSSGRGRRGPVTLYPSLTGPLPPPTWTHWTTSFGHTSRTSPTWPPTTPKPAWLPPSDEYSPSSRRRL